MANKALLYDKYPTHSETVTRLALALFDGLRDLHQYGLRQRRMLEIAARLHDIGWSRGAGGKHHKHSRDLILEMDIPGLDEQNRLICALIARYHTRALPDASRHRRFALLDGERRTLVEWLAGIVRVADGLDCEHIHAVRGLACEVDDDMILIRLESAGDCGMEIAEARQKQKLLERKVERHIGYRCYRN